ncbi:uncharacterized protein LOC125178418 [Hyalella azteca]|uniref:Uncharacterized protein LOC125178418 n=1 Tax=Hyalella azteca TaxID=294128 RepID=A0A979FNI7_HYAAZ|nr:uncharacterized protein LOC125178418 [Hyalella azteca]
MLPRVWYHLCLEISQNPRMILNADFHELEEVDSKEVKQVNKKAAASLADGAVLRVGDTDAVVALHFTLPTLYLKALAPDEVRDMVWCTAGTADAVKLDFWVVSDGSFLHEALRVPAAPGSAHDKPAAPYFLCPPKPETKFLVRGRVTRYTQALQLCSAIGSELPSPAAVQLFDLASSNIFTTEVPALEFWGQNHSCIKQSFNVTMGTLAVTTECIKKSVPFLVCSFSSNTSLVLKTPTESKTVFMDWSPEGVTQCTSTSDCSFMNGRELWNSRNEKYLRQETSDELLLPGRFFSQNINDSSSSLLLTTCQKEEFTCDDGQCVKLLQACDDRSDCADGSDESLVRCAISRTFRGGHPNNSSRPPRRQTELSLHVKRFNIVSIDEAAMVVTVSMSIFTRWRDDRFVFRMLRPDYSDNELTEEDGVYWQPVYELVGAKLAHAKAYSEGTISHKNLFAVNDGQPNTSLVASYETLLYSGEMLLQEEFEADFVCQFDTLFLPFGLDICEFKLMIRNAGTETPVFSGSVLLETEYLGVLLTTGLPGIAISMIGGCTLFFNPYNFSYV